MMSMTHVSTLAPLSRVRGHLHEISQRIERYRLFQRTLSELSALSDRDLYDLGITRGMVRDVAHDAAYKT